MKLLLVDNPGLAKLLAGMLGATWRVEVYMGAVIDLPQDALGIDVARDFRPSYVVRQPRIAKRLVKAIGDAEMVYIGTAPTLEADAQAWRLLKLSNAAHDKPVARVTLRGLTHDALLAALGTALPLDERRIEAGETLRAAERLVGYLLTPLVRRDLGDAPGIGYLSEIALAQIAAQVNEAPSSLFWLRAHFETEAGAAFSAEMVSKEGRRVTFDIRERGEQLVRMLRSASYWVAETKAREVTRESLPPHTLRTLIADAPYPPARTLAMATTLYERAYITNPLIDDAPLVPTGNPFTLEGDLNTLYVTIAERALAADAPSTTHTLRGAMIRAWWQRDQSVWLNFRARDAEQPLPPLGDLDSLRFIDGELVPVSAPAPLTEAALANDIYARSAAELHTAIASVAALVKSGCAVSVDGALRLTERGQRLHDWIAGHCPDLFALPNALRIDQIAAGRLSRKDALTALWARLQPALPQPDARPLVLHPLEA
jgi:DNA topoisomerase IA